MENEEKKRDVRTILYSLAVKHKGDWDKIYDDIRNKRKIPEEEIIINNDKFITLVDREYPEYIKQTVKQPFVLFYEGDIKILTESSKILAVINDNLASKYATDMVEEITSKLTEDTTFLVVLGTKKAQELTRKLLNKGSKIIAILDRGIGIENAEDKELYQMLKENQLLISVWPNSVKNKSQKTSVEASMLQGKICTSVLVGALSKKSVEYCAIAFALEHCSRIFCIPFQAKSAYVNNSLIHDGATLVEDAETIKYEE